MTACHPVPRTYPGLIRQDVGRAGAQPKVCSDPANKTALVENLANHEKNASNVFRKRDFLRTNHGARNYIRCSRRAIEPAVSPARFSAGSLVRCFLAECCSIASTGLFAGCPSVLSSVPRAIEDERNQYGVGWF